MTAEQRPPIKALLKGIEDLIVRLNAKQIENNRYAGNEQYHGIYVVLMTDSKKHKMAAPTANANIPMTADSSESLIIFRNTFQFLSRYSSLYLNMSERKKPRTKPMVKKAETFVTQVSYRFTRCVSLKKHTFTIPLASEVKIPLPSNSKTIQLSKPARMPVKV